MVIRLFTIKSYEFTILFQSEWFFDYPVMCSMSNVHCSLLSNEKFSFPRKTHWLHMQFRIFVLILFKCEIWKCSAFIFHRISSQWKSSLESSNNGKSCWLERTEAVNLLRILSIFLNVVYCLQRQTNKSANILPVAHFLQVHSEYCKFPK